jgi:hypothetical protein
MKSSVSIFSVALRHQSKAGRSRTCTGVWCPISYTVASVGMRVTENNRVIAHANHLVVATKSRPASGSKSNSFLFS